MLADQLLGSGGVLLGCLQGRIGIEFLAVEHVELGQPGVGAHIVTQLLVRLQRLEEHAQVAVAGVESLFRSFLVAQDFHGGNIGTMGAIARHRLVWEERPQGVELPTKVLPDALEGKGDVAQLLWPVVQRLVQVVENAIVVEYQAVPLQLVVRPVNPGDGLQQAVVAKAFIEIERLQDGGIEAG